jgi:hypothetical protein
LVGEVETRLRKELKREGFDIHRTKKKIPYGESVRDRIRAHANSISRNEPTKALVLRQYLRVTKRPVPPIIGVTITSENGKIVAIWHPEPLY